VTLYPDARALAPLVDGVILVVEADVTPVAVANRAVELIRDTGANLLGVVLNKRRDYIPDRVLQLVG
jgi:Mrp family chromosome partitioning ATPase